MTDREKVDRLIEILGKVKLDMKGDCKPCVAVKLVRARTLLNNVYESYERYLD
jgi:hypothetical protein